VLSGPGAVSAECAQAMAEGARRAFGTTYAVSTTGWAGPTRADEQPVGTVYYGLAAPDGVLTAVRHHLGQREQVRRHAAQTALDLLRRRALALPVPRDGGPDEAVRVAERGRAVE
jgi:nicotinamide-nucleotide amidase